MTIVKRLLSLQPDQKIKIGTNGGTAFFYVGTASDFVDNIWPYTVEAKDWIAQNCARSELTLKQMLRKDYAPRDYCEKLILDPLHYPTIDGYQDYLRDYFAEVSSAKRNHENLMRKKNDFTPLYEREIVEERAANDAIDPNCMIFIITGWESGTVWTSDEVECPSINFVRGADH